MYLRIGFFGTEKVLTFSGVEGRVQASPRLDNAAAHERNL